MSSRHVDLLQEGFDLALRVAAELEDSSLMARRMGLSTPLLCASPEYLREMRTRPLEVVLLLPSARQIAPKVRAFLEVVDRHVARQKPWS